MQEKLILLILLIAWIAGVFIILLIGNQRKGYRYRQYWCPFMAIILTALGIFCYYRYLLTNMGILADDWRPLKLFLDYVEIAYSLYIISIFAIIKIVVNEGSRIALKKGEAPKEISSLSFAYKIGEYKDVVIKKGWVFPGLFLRYLCWIVAFVLVALLAYKVIVMYQDRFVDAYSELFRIPVFTTFTLFILLESYWYLQHDKFEDQPELVQAEEEEKVEPKNYYNLWEEYQKIWYDHLSLAWFFQTAKEEPVRPDKLEIAQARILQNAGYDLTLTDYNIIENLHHRNDLLIDDVVADEIAPILFNTFLRRLMDGENILILTPKRSYKDAAYHQEVLKWVDDWLFKLTGNRAFFKVKIFSKVSDVELVERIIISSADDLLERNIVNNKWFINLKTILYLSGEELFSEVLTSNKKLMTILRKQYKEIQCIVLSNYRSALKEAVAQNLNIGKGLQEQRIIHQVPENSYTLFWKLEGLNLFQHKVFSGFVGKDLGPESVLSLLARRDQMPNINIVGQERLPWMDNLLDIDNNKNSLNSKPVAARSLTDKATREVISKEVTFLMGKKENGVIFARDTDNNAISTLKKWQNYVGNHALIHVISPAYLLRDYFIDNAEYFYEAQLYPFSSNSSVSRFEVARTLLEMLVSKEYSEREILEELVWVYPNATFVKQELHKLFRLAFSIDIIAMNYIQVKPVYDFDKQSGNFREITNFRLLPQIKDNIALNFLKDVQIVDKSGNLLKVIAYDMLFQNYLPRQFHAFNGKSYQIIGFDRQNNKLRTDERSAQKGLQYRPDVEVVLYSLDQPLSDAHKKNLSDRFSLELCEGKFDVITKGYFSFSKGISLKANDYTYTNISQAEVPIRKYQLGRMAVMTLYMDQREDAAKVTATLSVLLNEVLQSLFPETHQYVIVTALINELVFEGDFKKLFPIIGVHKREAEVQQGIVQLCILEDTHQDMGIVQSIVDRWQEVLQIADDYVIWLIDNSKNIQSGKKGSKGRSVFRKQKFKKDAFLKYGLDKMPEFFDLEGTSRVLRHLLGRNYLTTQRKTFYKK